MIRLFTVGLINVAVLLASMPAMAASADASSMMDEMDDLFEKNFPLKDGSDDVGLIERVMRSSEDRATEADTEDEPRSSRESAAVAPSANPPVRRPAPVSASPVATGPTQTVSSTAYCLTGRMASGRYVYPGAVAMNGVPLGSTYAVLTGPAAGRVLKVEDRIGSGSQFDVAYPGNCAQARQYGRRTINIKRLG